MIEDKTELDLKTLLGVIKMNSKELAEFIGGQIKKHRLDNGWTLEQVAKKVGTNRSTISNYETGYRSPRHDTLVVLPRMFNISIDDLFPPRNRDKQNENEPIIQKTAEIMGQLHKSHQEEVYDCAKNASKNNRNKKLLKHQKN